jgi:hypothetical protein
MNGRIQKGFFCIAVDIWQKGVKSDTRKTLVDTTTELFLLLPLIFFPFFFFCLKWSVSSVCLLCVCRFYRRVRSCTQSLLTGREFTTFFFSPFTWKDFLFILVVPCKVQYDTGINSLICPPPFLRVALHDRAASICTHTHTHTLAVSLCKYGIFKLDSTNKGMTASYYILYVCVCVRDIWIEMNCGGRSPLHYKGSAPHRRLNLFDFSPIFYCFNFSFSFFFFFRKLALLESSNLDSTTCTLIG